MENFLNLITRFTIKNLLPHTIGGKFIIEANITY